MTQSPQRITDPNWGMAPPPAATAEKVTDPNWGVSAAEVPVKKPTDAPVEQGFFRSAANALGIDKPTELVTGLLKLATPWGIQQAAEVITQTSIDAGKRAFSAYQRGDIRGPQGVLREATAAIPLIGPQMAIAQDQFATGNYWGSAGRTLGIVGPMALGIKPVMNATAATVRTATAPIRATGRMIQRGAAGAREGGIGGAIAGVVNAVAPSAPKTMIVQALKPTSKAVNFGESVDASVAPLVQAEQVMGQPITDLASFRKATDIAKQAVQNQLNLARQQANTQRLTVDLTPAADAVGGSIPAHVRFENPELAAQMVDEAGVYRQAIPLDQAEAILRGLNAEVDNFYRGYPSARGKALQTSADLAQTKAKADAVRQAVAEALDQPGMEGSTRALGKQYGALMDLGREAERRVNVAARQQPQGLSEQIGTVRAAADVGRGLWKGVVQGRPIEGMADIASGLAGRATAKYLKEAQTTDALLKRAFTQARGGAFAGRPPGTALQHQRPFVAAPLRFGPGADQSFARGVRAEYPVKEGVVMPPQQLLEAHGGRPMPASPDTSHAAGMAAGMDVQPGNKLIGEGLIRLPPPVDASGLQALIADRLKFFNPKTKRWEVNFQSTGQPRK